MRRGPAITGKKRFDNPRAELLRLRALYRDAALRGALGITGEGGLEAMRVLVGPDCAYHLYRCLAVQSGE